MKNGLIIDENDNNSSTIQLSCQSINFNLQICARCYSAFFTTNIRQETIASSSAYPILEEYAKWVEQQSWESKIQEENETIKNAFNAYQMAIKLCLDKEDE